MYVEEENEGSFGQEQVPLTDEIKDILYNYADGQIFKVRITYPTYGTILARILPVLSESPL